MSARSMPSSRDITPGSGPITLGTVFQPRVIILAAVIAAITLGHYLTGIQFHHYHDIFRRLYYLPIILGGIWFQLRGGLATAIVVSIVYAPHVVLQWGAHPDAQLEQYLEIILYNVIGVLTGGLARKEKSQRQVLETTAHDLEVSFQELKEQAKLILTFEEQLLRASRLSALGELAAGLAHEIRNPLGSIRGTAEIVKDSTLSEEQRVEFSAIMIREVDRLNQVVTNFLSFARPAPTEMNACDLNAVLNEIVEFSAVQCQKSQVSVQLVQHKLPLVSGDADQFKQVFLNLLLNAVQAMPGGGLLEVTTQLRDGIIAVTFKDNGPGIPKEILGKIFNPFFSTRHTGTGLGLAISQRIIQAHGGQIEVSSEVGEGARFEIQLPVVDEI
ncbi:ATP-binding protein [Desulfuromonas carbonis]|uniref:two-component system sensor histidine kinase NtrB n=1 Tax=Desulfuromonas sp. DDH964 TaxID=1823759 RepID=UPI00078EAF73|nr:ATP-binding protein [Desulfuromonas sp. DDH964]AMV72245.1 sensor histidine kinase [Desulfuromonas sp. DDH964]